MQNEVEGSTGKKEEFGYQSVFSMASDDPTSLRALCHITSVMEEKNLPLDYELNPNISEKATTVLLSPWWQLHISTLLACIYWCPIRCTSNQAEVKIVQAVEHAASFHMKMCYEITVNVPARAKGLWSKTTQKRELILHGGPSRAAASQGGWSSQAPSSGAWERGAGTRLPWGTELQKAGS
ncbi:uncharacterized protein AAGF69_004775 isoform 1-T1 [Amazona ochrocephala]